MELSRRREGYVQKTYAGNNLHMFKEQKTSPLTGQNEASGRELSDEGRQMGALCVPGPVFQETWTWSHSKGSFVGGVSAGK